MDGVVLPPSFHYSDKRPTPRYSGLLLHSFILLAFMSLYIRAAQRVPENLQVDKKNLEDLCHSVWTNSNHVTQCIQSLLLFIDAHCRKPYMKVIDRREG